ncbi:MAG: S-layer homology domain-containing protein, partial [Candidatus Gracilibacteria bacterium]
MPISSALKRVIASWIVVAFFISQTITFDISFSKPVIEEYGIVAILVESAIYNDTGSYDGLSDSYGTYLSEDSLAERIDRYAYDVQATLAMTKSLIIDVQPEDTVEGISAMLEKLYFEGDDIEGEKNHLVGVVVVGDVPLPVVTKGGNKFLSMLPYTDFEDKVYIFNPDTGNYERNGNATIMEPEAWHGVIVPPSTDLTEQKTQLAEYFDKNHLYHLGVTEYSEFDQKLFYGDMVAEEKAINSASFAGYQRYTENWENVAYNRYTRHLAKQLFIEAGGSVLDGDGIDNDGDGLIDEDPSDGIDNDGDGLLDEDFGDPFTGIDNDGDGTIDEDGVTDNDNDGDGKNDEDPIGDLNGDGCPGACGMDDDGDSVDGDDDGWPSGLEVMVGWNPFKKSSPFLFKLRDESLQDKFAALFIDEDPYFCKEGYVCWDGISKYNFEGYPVDENIDVDPNCSDADGVYHPEWDDDEDGYCDEDTDLDNDADGDGTANEDMFSEESSSSAFDSLPDIQSKNLFDQFTKKYYSLFEKLIAQIQDWTDYTGRYTAHYVDENGTDVTDMDSPMSIIGMKDAYTIEYLRSVNDSIEEQVDTVVDTVQEDVKLIANVNVQLSLNFEGEDTDDDGEPDEDPPLAVLGDPIYFINHSVSSSIHPFDIMIYGNSATEITSVKQCSTYLGSYDEEETGAELVEGLRVYNLDTAGEYDEEGKDYGGCFGNYSDMSSYGTGVSYLTFCFPEIASEPVRSVVGTKEILPGQGDESMTPDYRACNNFKELRGFLGNSLIVDFFTDESWSDTFSHLFDRDDKGYYYYAEEFTKELNKKFEDDHDDGDDLNEDGVYDEADFAIEIELLVSDLNNTYGAYDIPYTSLDDISVYDYEYVYDLISSSYDDEDNIPDFPESFTLADLFNLLGYDPESQDALTEFLLNNDGTFNLPLDDYGMESVDVSVTKYYVPDNVDSSWLQSAVFEDAFTDDASEAYSIPSTYYHKEPLNSTITSQVEAQFSAALPIDDPRFVSFQDQNKDYQEVYYPNVFVALDNDDFLTSLAQTDATLANIPGASSYSTTLQDYFDTSIDQTELADALAWMYMNIDQKHEYVLSHYLGPDEGYISDPENGYEIAYIVGDGDQKGYNFSFNGKAKVTDEDTELNNPESNYDPDSLPDDGGSEESGQDSYQALDLFAWLEMILLWVDDMTTTSLSISIDTACNSSGSCSEDSNGDGILDMAEGTTDENENGIPANAELSAYFDISADNSVKLYADGLDTTQVTVKTMDDYGALNGEDSFTQVQLDIVSGGDFGNVTSQNPTTVINGVASFTVTSTTEPGAMQLQAVAVNNDVNDSDYASLESTKKRVALYTYDIETVVAQNVYTTQQLQDLVLLDSDGNVVASVDAETGAIEFMDDSVSLEAMPAVADLPTRIGFHDDTTDEILGVLYVVPAVSEVNISDSVRSLSEMVGVSDVQVRDANEDDSYFLQYKQGDTSEVYLWEGTSRVIASFKSNGQVFVRDDLGVSIELNDSNFASEFNIYIDSQKIAEVKIGVDFDEPSIDIEVPAENNSYEDYLSGLIDSLWQKIPVVFAASSSLPDSDADSINDLYEYTIGTNLISSDTDGDEYSDFDELQNGFDPLSPNGAPLFTDLNSTDESYSSVLELYLRGILDGYDDGSFRPDNPITREEFTKLNLGGICLYCDSFSADTQTEINETYNKSPFPDTDISEGLYFCIAESKNESLISGYKGGENEGYYLPTTYISRAEAAKVILQAAANLDSSFASNDYLGTDKPWYYNYVIKAQSLGLFPEEPFVEVSHYSSDKFKEWFDPQLASDGIFIGWLEGNITRAQFAIMIANLIEIYDCRGDDWDGDGLSNNEEIYTYGTDPYDPDTDDGGVTDFVEVVYDMDPLDASDDSSVGYTEPMVTYD